MATQENRAAFVDRVNATATALISVASHGVTSGPVDASPALETPWATTATVVERVSTAPLSLVTAEVSTRNLFFIKSLGVR